MTESNGSIVDLTDCSFTLVDHRGLNNIVIDLDSDDLREEVGYPRNTINTPSRTRRQRRPTRTPRVRISAKREIRETPVHDLCTPENKPKKRSSKSNKASDGNGISIAEDLVEGPKAKKAKQQLGSCPICYEEFNGQELVSTKCGHVYCKDCLQQALRREPRCPTCRTSLRGKLAYHSIFL